MRRTTAYRVSAPKFDRMAAAGLFDDDRVELLDGILTMMTSGPAHDYSVTVLGDRLEDRLGRERWTVREEKPVHLGLYWKPMPDIAVVRGPAVDYARRTPRRGDLALIVEVSDTTYAVDSGKKLKRYERCRVPLYWIVDLSRRCVELRELTGRNYSEAVTFGESDELPLILDGLDHGRIAVADLLT